MELALAERYHWTPEQMGSMDPDFLVEALARLGAEAELSREEQQRQERKRRRDERRRRLGMRRTGQDVGIEEIA